MHDNYRIGQQNTGNGSKRSGALIRSLLEAAQIAHDDYDQIQLAIKKGVADSSVEAILLNGGTGIAARDVTYEAVHNLLEKEMHGFGEIFRFLSFTEDIGAAAILSRAIAGIRGHKAIFSMPGSSGAVKLAMSRIIIPELRHVMREIYKDMS